MSRYTFRGSNSTIFCYVSLLNEAQLLKERICSPWSKFFSLRVGAIWKDYTVNGAYRKTQKLFPMVKIANKKMKVYPLTLKLVSSRFIMNMSPGQEI